MVMRMHATLDVLAESSAEAREALLLAWDLEWKTVWDEPGAKVIAIVNQLFDGLCHDGLH